MPARSPFGNGVHSSSITTSTGSSRLGAGSPSHELGGRLYTRRCDTVSDRQRTWLKRDTGRAREIQAQEGVIPVWGPPASGQSTPLREAIPESPNQEDGFPGLVPPSQSNFQSPTLRVRAGTLPSRFSTGGPAPGTNSPGSVSSKSARPTPSSSPFKAAGLIEDEVPAGFNAAKLPKSTLLSRLRAGSLPQRTTLIESPNPFGSALFAMNWSGGRERASTLQSIRSADAPESPLQSSPSKDGLNDADVKTLDYLGLAENPHPNQGGLTQSHMHGGSSSSFTGERAELNRSSNRFRSYSVNATEQYAQEVEEYGYGAPFSGYHSGVMTPIAASTAAALVLTRQQIHEHNLAVQAFATHASATRPRAQTAGILDSPARIPGNHPLSTPSTLGSAMTAADYRVVDFVDYTGLPEAVRALQLNGVAGRSKLESSDEINQDGPTRALWLGNIPTSTTSTSLEAIFLPYGKIDSSRVLSQKNCGFVNFEAIESAIQAKSILNGKELFPGAGPIKIGYAKVPSASVSGTASNNDAFQSRSPEPYGGEGVGVNRTAKSSEVPGSNHLVNGLHAPVDSDDVYAPDLSDIIGEMWPVLEQLGATSNDHAFFSRSLDAAMGYAEQEKIIPPVAEPSRERVHDAPKLREIRKRIDTDSIRSHEMEEIAMNMLPEIAELSSDYLGNTVVQKLFEHCSESVKEEMLIRIAPVLAELGVHKNGTWAAQKIIERAKVPSQKKLIAKHLGPYTLGLFLDQYGNYVLQGCLPFGSPWNNFVFEAVLSRIWPIGQNRYAARAVRALLENHHTSKNQLRLITAAIVLYSVQLAMNVNGAILLTWYLDTCTLPGRRTVLAPQLVPHLVKLCTHKLAYLTVLKVMNQRNESEARDMVLRALFFSENDEILEAILKDQACGATFIFKTLSIPFPDEAFRAEVTQKVRAVLCRLKASPSQGYKRLMDEVGLSARVGRGEREHQNGSRPGSRQDRNRPVSHHGPGHNGKRHQTEMERQYSGHYVQPASAQQHFPVHAGIPMSSAMDLNSIPAYDHYTPAFPTAFNQSYRSVLLNSSTPGISSGNFYPVVTSAGMNGYISPPAMDPNFANMHAQQSSMNQRPMPMPIGVTPQLGQVPFGAPPGFNSLMTSGVMGGAYQYPMQYLAQPQQMMHQQSGGRRGRVWF